MRVNKTEKKVTKLMNRFLDSWVVERTLFDYVNMGSCACCAFSQAIKQDHAALCSDWETDDARKEKKSLWPLDMQEDVWAERVKFRRLLKEGLPTYQDRNRGKDRFFEWLARDDVNRVAIFQMPIEHLKEFIQNNFRHSYQVVLTSVMHQTSNYNATGYCNDGATDAEIAFEECLFTKHGAFVLEPELYDTEEGRECLFQRFEELGGAHLMEKRDEDKKAGALGTDAAEESRDVQSFRADRRLLRIVICRYYADMAWKKYQKSLVNSS